MVNTMIHDVAEIRLWQQTVGALALDRQKNLYTFEYHPNWLKSGIEIAPLTMPIASGQTPFSFPRLNEETFKGLPGCLADSLPDDFGNAVINAWLGANGRDIHSFSAVERLLYTSTRGMGALEFYPGIGDENTLSSQPLALNTLLETAQQVLDAPAHAGGSLNMPEEALSSILQVGTSAGGARPKAVVALNADRTEIRSGQIDAPAGFEHYLLKFDGVSEKTSRQETFGDPLGYGLMEYTYYQMAKLCGIEMAHCELLFDGNRAHFLTQRFDRDGNDKHHVQTLCAMEHTDYKNPGHYSYEALLQTARKLKLSRKEAIEIYRRMVFNVIARNHDDHTKNFAFMLNKSGKWQLAPAYDLAFSYRPGSKWVAQHNISLNQKRDDFQLSDLQAVATQISNFTTQAKQIIEQTQDAVSRWPQMAKANDVPVELRQYAAKHHRLSW
jgi:serine/threonine-protein kinase HipA